MNLLYPSEPHPSNSSSIDSFIRVCVVDGYSFRRGRLVETLRAETDFIVHQFEEPREVIQRLRTEQKFVCLIQQPQQFSERIHEYVAVLASCSEALLMLLHDSSPSILATSIVAGFRGYYSEALESGNLVPAIRAVHAGAIWISGGTDQSLDSLAHSYVTAERKRTQPLLQDCKLSEREKIVLSYIAVGLTNGQIAEALHVSVATIKANLRSAFHKLNVHDRTRAAVCAREQGLI